MSPALRIADPLEIFVVKYASDFYLLDPSEDYATSQDDSQPNILPSGQVHDSEPAEYFSAYARSTAQYHNAEVAKEMAIRGQSQAGSHSGDRCTSGRGDELRNETPDNSNKSFKTHPHKHKSKNDGDSKDKDSADTKNSSRGQDSKHKKGRHDK